MVSRILLAVPRRAMAFLFLLAVLLLSAPGTQAKNPYEMHNEGDPGDGVLQPRPHVIPEPEPVAKGYFVPAYFLVLIDLGNNQFIPVFQVSDFSETPTIFGPGSLRRNISEGRWHRAP